MNLLSRSWYALLGMGAMAAAACVPADEAIGLGSVQFTFTVSTRTEEGVTDQETQDFPPWSIHFDRIVLGFKTMTIGKIGVSDVCSYRGRGASADVVFDPRVGVVQTFNGIQPVECPDVGIIFGAPSDATTLGNGVTSKDLVELATGSPAHAIVEATAKTKGGFAGSTEPRTLKILLRFDEERTSTRFGGCRAAARGVRILERQRDEVSVRFAAENLFRDAISTSANLRVNAFAQADRAGNRDDIVTMDELDDRPLTLVGGGDYQLPDGNSGTSLGDFVRFLFRFSVMFRTEEGLCVGNEPGADETGTVQE